MTGTVRRWPLFLIAASRPGRRARAPGAVVRGGPGRLPAGRDAWLPGRTDSPPAGGPGAHCRSRHGGRAAGRAHGAASRSADRVQRRTRIGYGDDPVPEVYPAASSPAADASVDRLISWLTSGGTVVPKPPAGLGGHGHVARELFAADLAVGEVPSIRAIRSGLSVGQDRAQQVQAYLHETTRT